MNLPLKTIIVENEKDDLKVLTEYLIPYSNLISLEKCAVTFEEAVNILLNQSFELSLLDIQLNDNTDCYELINKVGRQQFGIIVFSTQKTSAPLEYTKTLSGHLYLPKPYSPEGMIIFTRELNQELARVKNTSVLSGKDKPLLIKDRKATFFIEQDKIVFIEVDDDYCHINCLVDTGIKEFVVWERLKHYEEILNHSIFYRISDKHLINLSFLDSLNHDGVKLKAKVANKEFLLPLPDKKKQTFLLLFIK
jgi:DNA-binding LytR/AlgR family response regulator